jgi:hypothetical protein
MNDDGSNQISAWKRINQHLNHHRVTQVAKNPDAVR